MCDGRRIDVKEYVRRINLPRMYIVASTASLVWVFLRTLIMDMYGLELYGIDFERWDDDMIFVNIALPILGPVTGIQGLQMGGRAGSKSRSGFFFVGGRMIEDRLQRYALGGALASCWFWCAFMYPGLTTVACQDREPGSL